MGQAADQAMGWPEAFVLGLVVLCAAKVALHAISAYAKPADPRPVAPPLARGDQWVFKTVDRKGRGDEGHE